MTTITVMCPCGCNHTFQAELPKKEYAPREGSIVSQIWGLCRSISGQTGFRATRKQVLEAGRTMGLNDATLSTQFQRWLVAEGKNLPVQPAPVVQVPAVAAVQAVQEVPKA